MITEIDLNNRFSYHPPREGQASLYVQIRDRAHELARFIVNNSPASREQSVAITKLEEVVMWANAGIARN